MKQVTMFLIAPLIVMVSLANHWAPAYAQWLPHPNLNTPICIQTNVQKNFPATVSDEAGGTIITWNHGQTNSYSVYAQRINASGIVQWTYCGVNCGYGATVNVPLLESLPVISDGYGGAIITWFDQSSANIYGQHINGAGVTLWGPQGMAITTPGDQFYPTIASDGVGGAIIAWQKRVGFEHDVYAQRVNASGVLLWTLEGIPVSSAVGPQGHPAIVSDGVGGAIITWYDRRTGGYDIYAQRINASGVRQWVVSGDSNGIAISTAPGDQLSLYYSPVIVSDAAGGAIIAWQDERSGVNSTDIYGQRINASGVVQWAVNGIPISAAPHQQLYPTAVTDGVGGIIITWQDARSGTNYDVYAQRINASGIAQWEIDGLAVSGAASSQNEPTIASDGAGGAIISWQDFRSGLYYDIYAQRINASGIRQWIVTNDSDGVAISTAAHNQFYPAILRTGTEGAIITWQDYRSGSYYDIYAQKIDQFGYLGNAAPLLSAVRDVPQDQGGKVTVAWNRSYLDEFPNQIITYYSIWRGANLNTSSVQSNIPLEQMKIDFSGEAYRIIQSSNDLTNWEWIANVPSHYFPSYSYTASTLADSSSQGIPYFTFLVSAHTFDPFTFWDSNVDSGYSVDNLPPFAPLDIVGIVVGDDVVLNWNPNTENDFAFYEVYRSAMPNFDPDTMTANATTSDTTYTDANVPQGNSYYALRAVDIHGNRSPKSNEVAINLVGVQDLGKIPTEFSLKQNFPNPFNPSTVIQFDIPTAGFVSLKVYDYLGQEMAVLVKENLLPGRHQVDWNATGFASGVYFYRLQTSTFTETKKLVLVR